METLEQKQGVATGRMGKGLQLRANPVSDNSERREISCCWNITKSIEFRDEMDKRTNKGPVGRPLENAKTEIANHARALYAPCTASEETEVAKSIDTGVLWRVPKRPCKHYRQSGRCSKKSD